MNTTLKRFSNLIPCFMLLAFCLTSCSNIQEEDDPSSVEVYYLKSDEDGMVCEDYHVLSDMSDTKAVIEELLAKMKTMPEKLEYEAPIYGPVNLLTYGINGNVLTLNFAGTYSETDKTTEILDRAAMVRTLTQVPGIDYVTFTVERSPLLDGNGKIIGNMSADSFVYNAGNEINTYEKVELVLYFATDEGHKLIPVYRSVVYNSNILMQRLAIEQLLKGPNTDLARPTLNPQTKINSVSVRDGVCYVDFDEGFITPAGTVDPKVALYSLVNTVCETADVNKVQISVNGQTSVTFMEKISLDTIFERNLDIVSE